MIGLWLFCMGSQNSFGQSGSFIQVTVGPNISGATFYVDNVSYTSAQVFRWQVGDVHVVRFLANAANAAIIENPSAPASGLGTRYVFSNYTVGYTSDAIQTPPTGAVQVSEQSVLGQTEYAIRIQTWSFLKSLTFNVVKQYRMRFVTPAAGCAPSAAEPVAGACGDLPGYTHVRSLADGSEFLATTGDYWVSAGDVEMEAIPAVGYAFKDWNSNPGLINNGAIGVPGSIRFTLTETFTIQVNFGPGKFYRIGTEPAGLDVIVDRVLIRTSAPDSRIVDLCKQYASIETANGGINVGQGGDGNKSDYCFVWLQGSTRLLAAPELQLDKFGNKYVFDSWSFGGGQNALFEVSGANLSTDTITGKFLLAGGVTFVTQPQVSLPLIVNNRTWPSYNFWFGQNQEIAFSAPYESVDANGKRWRFKSWSNGGPAAQTLKITEEIVKNGLYLVANYEPLNKLSIETNPAGLPVVIDGKQCQTPCAVEKLPTESATISPVRSVTQADVLRLEFANWADGGSGDRTVGFEPAVRRLVANYKQLYRFSAISNPPGNATFTFTPASADQFYDAGTSVTVSAKAANGYRFRRWLGDTAGLFPSATVTLSGPRGVVAELEAIPYLDPAGIRNSAGTGPQDEGDHGRVAAGSLITVYGTNLTPKEEVGPRNVWAQSLADVVARVGDRYLPLSYASGSQINAQLPYDFAPGNYKLTLTRTGQAEVNADFEVVRNAPGLFGQYGTDTNGEPQLAFAFRPDGSVVTEAAAPNEILYLIGTGIGPYRNNPPAGFAVPSGTEFPLADSVEVIAGDQVIQPLKVIATPGFVGMTSVQIRIGSQFPAGQSTKLRIRVNGKESNTVRVFVK